MRLVRYLVPLVLLGLAVHIILPQIATMEHSLQVIKAMKLWAVALAVLAQTLSYLGSGYLLKTLVAVSGQQLSVLRGTIVHYEGEGLAGLLWGDFEEVIVRAEMVDQASGAVLGTANCIGRTTTTARKGVENKANGLAKSLASWIAKNSPPR